jgi:aminoglycoside phosphotransferase (APT) family kinase protein
VLAKWESDVVAALGLQVEVKFPGGIHGASGVRSAGGVRSVLKIFPAERETEVRRAIDIAGRLRARGAPVPDPYMVGTAAQRVFTLQHWCAGNVARPLRQCHARALFDAWELHAGACPEGGTWPESLWVDHGPLRSSGGNVSDLLDEIVGVGRTLDPRRLARTDAVHMDWHHRNVLADAETVTAIFDWEMARAGDARFDLVVLAFWSEVYRGTEVDKAAADEIRAFVANRVDPQTRAWLSALQAAMQLSFTTVNRPDLLAEVTGNVERFLAPWWR